MQVHKSNYVQLSECVLVIGALDGLHKGHQALIHQAKKSAEKMGVPLAVYTFDPPPKVFFQHAMLLTPLDEKLEKLNKLGVDHAVIARFNAQFMTQSTNAFLDELGKLNPRKIFEGHDFRFGRNREGDIQTLRRRFTVSLLNSVLCEDGKVISSTRIRNLFAQGKFEAANDLLNWGWMEEASLSSTR
ncbi:FAD synthetase family protein [Bacillus norwichensis]|uniref:FAD synthase n=1 Tax=Bacillus norwichensis TaxID=2762217 RepID=A0ABR8VR17_9BACI|nr:FAD synthetase family protein [Bacillus norwichensis]MBD8007197.1 FAD synthetase family protein [Bacillus norwichensis]